MGLVAPLVSYQTCSKVQTKEFLHRSELNRISLSIINTDIGYIGQPEYERLNGARYFHGTMNSPALHYTENARLFRPRLFEILNLENVERIGLLTEDYDLLLDCDVRIAAMLATLNTFHKIQIIAVHIRNKRGPELPEALSAERIEAASGNRKAIEDMLLNNARECQNRSEEWLDDNAKAGISKQIWDAGKAGMSIRELQEMVRQSDTAVSEGAQYGRKDQINAPLFRRVRMPSKARH